MKGLKHFQSKTYQEMLSQMCKQINVDPEEIDFNEPGWFYQHEWTTQQEDAYKEWLITYFLANKKRVKEIAAFPGLMKQRKNLENLIDEFIFNYGWRVVNK